MSGSECKERDNLFKIGPTHIGDSCYNIYSSYMNGTVRRISHMCINLCTVSLGVHVCPKNIDQDLDYVSKLTSVK